VENKEQAEFFVKLLEGCDRLAALKERATALNCELLVIVIPRLADDLRKAVIDQQKLLDGKPLPFVLAD
jgi:hypothetical protein